MTKTWQQLATLALLSIVLMTLDHRTSAFTQVRTSVSALSLSFYWIEKFPATVYSWFQKYNSDGSVYRKYIAVKKQNVALQGTQQRYDGLRQQNQRLKTLLNLSQESETDVVVAEVIKTDIDPYTRKLVVDRGSESGVYIGQPVVGVAGVLGQISEVGIKHSVVIPITNPSHALPVQVQRNGLRTIVRGSGTNNRVEIPFLSSHVDIRIGDILVTSGLGGGFPANYKVATVSHVVVDPNKSFIEADATPFSLIEQTEYVLLLSQPQSTAKND